MSAPLDEALEGVLDQLTSAGIPASGHPRDLPIPGVLVTPQTFTFDRLDGATYAAKWDLHLLTRDTGHGNDALADLSELAGMLREQFAVSEFRAVTLTLPNVGGPDGMPCLHCTLSTTITED